MARYISLEKFVEGEVIGAGDVEKMERCGFRGDGGDVGVAILYGLAGEILHYGLVVHQIGDSGDDFGCGEGHDGGDALETPGGEFVDVLDEVGVGELHSFAAFSEGEKKIVLFDFAAEGWTGEAFAVPAHENGGVHASEHRGLPGGGLGEALGHEVGVNGYRVTINEAAQGGAHLRIHRIVG